MFIQSVYASVATEAMPKSKLYKLLSQARVNNKLNNITGLLIYVDGVFLQVLEGPAEVVSVLLETIKNDSRHKELKIIYKTDIEERLFSSWKMAYVSPSPKELATWAGLRNTTTVQATLEAIELEPTKMPLVLRTLLSQIPEKDLEE